MAWLLVWTRVAPQVLFHLRTHLEVRWGVWLPASVIAWGLAHLQLHLEVLLVVWWLVLTYVAHQAIFHLQHHLEVQLGVWLRVWSGVVE